MTTWLLILTQFSIVAFAILAGVFLAFSDFIMRALSVTEGSGGAGAMQAINREVFRYLFIPLFLAMVPVSLVLSVGAYLTLERSLPFLAAAGIYLIGAFGVTLICNVPLNNRLAELDVGSAEGMQFWEMDYLPRWTFWNGVRTGACCLASVLLLFGLVRTLAV